MDFHAISHKSLVCVLAYCNNHTIKSPFLQSFEVQDCCPKLYGVLSLRSWSHHDNPSKCFTNAHKNTSHKDGRESLLSINLLPGSWYSVHRSMQHLPSRSIFMKHHPKPLTEERNIKSMSISSSIEFSSQNINMEFSSWQCLVVALIPHVFLPPFPFH